MSRPERGAIGRLARRLLPRWARNWMRAPGMTLRWWSDELRHAAGLDLDVVMRPGWSLRAHPAADRLAYRASRTDPEQIRELDGFIATCRPDMQLIDLGAHFGVFSLAALHFGGAAARALAVDPSPTACRMLRIQARTLGVEDRLVVMPAAVGARSGTHPMLPIGVIAGGYFTDATEGYASRDLLPVTTVTLDGLVAQTGIRPTHVKIDVEGSELDVITGGQRVLSDTAPPIVFIELHTAMVRAAGGDPAAAPAALERLGYRLSAPDGSPVSIPALLQEPLTRVIARRATT